jgi:hypothetical protein
MLNKGTGALPFGALKTTRIEKDPVSPRREIKIKPSVFT